MKKPADQLVELVKAGNLAGVTRLLGNYPDAARTPRPALAAAGMAWRDCLQVLQSHGADLNAMWRGFRPLHALMQESPHAHGGAPGPERLACLQWLLENGADPELEAAWPPSRALLIAAFTGVPEYVSVLHEHGAKVDGFVHAALGD